MLLPKRFRKRVTARISPISIDECIPTRSESIWQRPDVRIAVIVLVVITLLAIFAPLVAPYDPDLQNFRNRNKPPTLDHLCGTDYYGRDVLSRVIYGARVSLAIGFLATAFAMLIGVTLGVSAGFLGGRLELVVMRFVDVMMAIPMIITGLLMVAALGSGFQTLIVAIGISMTPRLIRLARAPVLVIKQREYIQAARALGLPNRIIIFSHIIPQVVPPLIVIATLQVCHAIVIEASISFLGLGIQPPMSSWGGLLKEGLRNLPSAPWISLTAGVVLTITVIVLNILGDALRDSLDPRLRGRIRAQ
ncbi:MAG: ABC transporter permease [Chloroflexi bacterium]|nr:ABC transporter permease [Chloroflexota bacterium]